MILSASLQPKDNSPTPGFIFPTSLC